jgi:hypothetical protein
VCLEMLGWHSEKERISNLYTGTVCDNYGSLGLTISYNPPKSLHTYIKHQAYDPKTFISQIPNGPPAHSREH